MSHATRRPRKTLEDYLALPDDVRAELIDGELYVTPAPTPQHQRTVARLWCSLEGWLREEELGEAFLAPLDVHLPTGEVVQPDLLVVKSVNPRIVKPDAVHGVPDLVVEVVSPAQPERDRYVKRQLYARNAVREFWIVDPAERTVEALLFAKGAYRPAGYFQGNEVVVSETLEGLALSLKPIFEG